MSIVLGGSHKIFDFLLPFSLPHAVQRVAHRVDGVVIRVRVAAVRSYS